MTPTRLAKAGTIVLFVAVWVVGAAYLWRTKVPKHLDVSGVDPHRYFTDRQLARTAHYANVSRLIWVSGTVTQLVVLVVLAFLGRRLARGFDLGKVGTGVLVGTFATLTVWLATLPFGFLDLWWNRRYNLSERSYLSWVLEQWPSLLGQVVGLTILLTFLMLMAGWLRRWWWVAAGPILVTVGLGLAFVVSWASAIGTHPIRNPQIAQDVRDLAHREGVPNTKVRVEKVSDQTHLVNAETLGPAQATVVIFWDTAFDGRLSRRAVDAIAAHELGHVARKHIWKGVGWSALFTLPLLLVLAEATRRFGGIDRPEVVPFALLVLAVLNLVALPVSNVISRRYEGEADWMALRATHDPRAMREIFRQFANTDFEQPNPPGWDYVLLENHPTLVQRIAMANDWENRNRR